MYKNEELEAELKYSYTIDNQQAVFAEWNMNAAFNVQRVGNYRYRPGTQDPSYSIISPVYDPEDASNNYTGATDADIMISAGFDDNDEPAMLVAPKRNISLLYSLDECLKPHRPRSGINKLLYLGRGQTVDGLTSGISNSVDVSRRPRYYMASRNDDFKYWTSYRTQVADGSTQEFGVSLGLNTGSSTPSYYIYDAAPFVVYGSEIPTNKIVVKVQTNVGEVDNGPFRIGNNTNIPDPLYGYSNSTVPRRWAIQVLRLDNSWEEVISFSETETRSNGDPIVGSDGVVEIEYGLSIPEGYDDIFTLVGTITSTNLLPDLAPNGYAYLYKQSDTDKGVLFVSDGSNWVAYNNPDYGWSLSKYDITKTTKVVKDFTNPDFFIHNSLKRYREFELIKGIRIVVDTMNKSDCTFDLIEMSPRLVADITNKTISYSVNKVLSDLGSSNMPTGNLLAGTGSIEIFDEDGSFNENNPFNSTTGTGSIISNYLNMQIKFIFFDIVKNIGNYDYYIPVKHLYSERVPQTSDSRGVLSFGLRDLFFLLESKKAPELLMTNVSLSYAITVLLDNIGFSNYSFKRADVDDELIIPYFFVNPNQNVAEILQQLAISSQSAMFFDEYNNFVVMSKNYVLAESSVRDVDAVLYGQETPDGVGVALPNIINLSSQEKKVLNNGEINYTTRYIQKTIGSISQAPYTDEYKTYVYKPVLLWEVAGQEATKTINDQVSQSSGYSLAAIPLKTTLTDEVPEIGYEIYDVLNKKREAISSSISKVTLTLNTTDYLFVGQSITVSGVGDSIDGTWTIESILQGNNIFFYTPIHEDISEGTISTGSLFDSNQPINNNIIDFGEGVYWLGNYSGYFYANAEIIRYDAVEYSVAGVGTVWITNNQQYQEYFSKLKFNGKIYPTGRVRIYSNIDNGQVIEHGRGQFGTDIVIHHAGLSGDSEWTLDSNVKGIIQNARSYLFNTNSNILYPTDIGSEESGKSKIVAGETYTAESYAIKSTRNGIIKNFTANTNLTELETNYYKSALSGSIQSSALVFNGPNLPTQINPADFVTYCYKTLDRPYKSFGTRMRIIGKIQSGTNNDQEPIGLFDIYPSDLASTDPSKQISLSGGGGGIGFSLNKETNIGYFFEIEALSQNSISSYKNNTNILSYTITKSPILSVSSNTVTVQLASQHDFNVGEKVVISGVVDDNKKTSPTAINGEYQVLSISQDRKQFTYSVLPITTTATITDVTGNGTNAVFTADGHNFVVGNIVTLTNVGAYSGSGKIITAVGLSSDGKKTFTTATTLNTNLSALTGTATYETLTTTSANGGTVTKNVDENTLISNVFFYKTVSGYNQADVIKKKAALEPVSTGVITSVVSNYPTASIKYIGANNFIVGQTVIVTGLSPSQYNVTGTVLECTPESFTLSVSVAVNPATNPVTQSVGTAASQNQRMVVTLTTLRQHELLEGEPINVTNISGTGFNGSFIILSVGEKTIKYASSSASNTAETDLSPLGLVSSQNLISIPKILWRGFAEIIVDDGKFTGQSRLLSSEKSTSYDLAVEHIDIGTTRQFYLYINDKQIAVVTDPEPIKEYNNVALFVRGSSKCMFENVYALSDDFSTNRSRALQLPVSQAFSSDEITEAEALSKYAISGLVQNTFLSGISSQSTPLYSMYYDEFGTIMREAAYFNIKYDRAYPALYATLAKTINRMKGYTVSGFFAGSYGAEFLIFNAVDKNLNLDDTSGNYLRIIGIAFTQNTTNSLKVDDFFKKNSNFVNSLYSGYDSSEEYKKIYNDIVNSRNRYGVNEFSIQSEYIQTDAAAEEMMDWILKRSVKPKLTVGVNTFSTPHLQLGDIVNINCIDSNGLDMVSSPEKRFVIYNIQYQKGNGQFTTTINLAEI